MNKNISLQEPIMTVQLIILDYCWFYDGTDIMVFCKSKTQTLSSFEKPVVAVVVFFFQ